MNALKDRIAPLRIWFNANRRTVMIGLLVAIFILLVVLIVVVATK